MNHWQSKTKLFFSNKTKKSNESKIACVVIRIINTYNFTKISCKTPLNVRRKKNLRNECNIWNSNIKWTHIRYRNWDERDVKTNLINLNRGNSSFTFPLPAKAWFFSICRMDHNGVRQVLMNCSKTFTNDQKILNNVDFWPKTHDYMWMTTYEFLIMLDQKLFHPLWSRNNAEV